ncbi:MAG TPA: hypothetical protein PLY43_04340, partial [Ruminococcus sp.]|nr:hypothetical protein [Ruminococcus sp.]
MKTYKKILAGVLAAAVSAGATGSIAYAKNLGKEEAASQMKEKAQAGASAERTASSAAACKDETVYVLCDTDSSVKNVVVSDWLKNAKAAGTLSDISTLSDIVNVKGDEIFAQSGDELDWSAQGNDIYYKGTTDKELPVDVTISYFLDGKEVSPKEITGKSGHLTIRWSYTNKQKSTATINGEKQDIYVPFMAASAAVLDTGKFLNVEVKNGKVISDGERLIVVGAAFPGLSESLGLDDLGGSDLSLPDSFELSADVTDFAMNTSVTVVSNEIFSQLDLDDDSLSFGELSDKLKELSDGANRLCDGAAQLYDGISTLSDKSGDLTDGIDKLLSGSEELKNGAAKLSDGSGKLAGGAKSLSEGASTLDNGVKSAKDGSAQLYEGLGQAGEGAAQLTDGLKKADEGASSLSEGLSEAKNGSAELVKGFERVTEGTSSLNEGASALGSGAASLSEGS